MNIAIIGSGNIGGNLARLLVRAGHTVALANSRGPASLQSFVDELGPNLKPLEKDAAARFGEVVFLATPWLKPEGLPSPDAVQGKIVVDTRNPFNPDFSVIDTGGPSSAYTQKQLPGARIVKAFNTMNAENLVPKSDPNRPFDARYVIPVAGDDHEAKLVVLQLVADMGFGPLDVGNLITSQELTEPGRPLSSKLMSLEDAKVFVQA